MEKIFQGEWLGRPLSIKTGKIAKQANAAIWVQYGETVVQATVVQSKSERDGIDFFPLMVEFEEKLYAAGIIKGSRWVKREGRPTDQAVLTGRMIDRSIRPLFDTEDRRDVQVILTLLTLDEENDYDIVSLVAASAALAISGLAWSGPLGGIRVGLIEDKFVFNPTFEEQLKSSLDLIVAGTEEKVVMIEAGANEIKEDVMYEAIVQGQEQLQGVIKIIKELKAGAEIKDNPRKEKLKSQADLEGEKEKLATQKEQLSAITAIAGKSDSELRTMRMTRESIEKQVSASTARVRAQEGIVAGLEEELKITKVADAAASAVAEKEASGEAKRATAAKREKEAADYINANTKAREDAIAALELQAKAEGRNVENSELLAIYQKSYVDLVSQSNGLVTTSNQAAKTLLDTTLGLLTAEEGITDEKEAQEKADEQLTELQSALGEIQRELTDSDALRQQMSALDEYYAQVIDNELITAEEKEKIAKEYAEKKAILEDQITATEKAAQQERIASYFEAVNTFATQYASIMSSISDLASQMIEDQATIKTAELEEQYSAGEISAEEYEKKLTEIEKEAAEKKYKIAMWEWSSQILTAVANTAQGATKALAQGGYLGLITAALVTAAGGAQLATIIANKPIKPTFATGGIVPGTSYTGDRVEALVNSGEMILNSAQQKRLFDSLNGGSAAGGSRIQVYNSAANDVRVEPQITEDGIRIMIRKTVAKDTADGRFNSASRIAQTTQRGTRYTN